MNKQRKQQLRDAISNLESVSNEIYSLKDQEYDCMSNIPENLQSTDMYYDMENNVDVMDDAINSINDAYNSLRDII